MTTLRLRLRASVLVLCAAAVVGAGLPAFAESVSGVAVQALPCIPTSYDAVSTQFDCQGTSTWEGTWNGQAVFHAKGKLDLITGDASGTVEERFFGATANGHAGELHVSGTVTIDGVTGLETVRVTILDGSVDFKGATGSVTFLAFSPLSGGPAEGTYSGTWTHPAY